MEVRLGGFCGGPTHPFWKVVVVDDRAEVAEIPCDSWSTENLVYHGDLEERLGKRHPELANATGFMAGWLSLDGEEAVLRLQVLASGISKKDAKRIGEAVRGWCESAGVRVLTIADSSSRDSNAPASKPSDWALE